MSVPNTPQKWKLKVQPDDLIDGQGHFHDNIAAENKRKHAGDLALRSPPSLRKTSWPNHATSIVASVKCMYDTLR